MFGEPKRNAKLMKCTGNGGAPIENVFADELRLTMKYLTGTLDLLCCCRWGSVKFVIAIQTVPLSIFE